MVNKVNSKHIIEMERKLRMGRTQGRQRHINTANQIKKMIDNRSIVSGATAGTIIGGVGSTFAKESIEYIKTKSGTK